MARRGYSKGSFKIILISVVLMVVIKVFVLGDLRKPEPALEDTTPTPVAEVEQHSFNDVVGMTVFPKKPAEVVQTSEPEPGLPVPQTPEIKPAKPLPAINNVRALPAGERPKIVVIIDDMGVSARGTKDITNLPGPLTLAFLPYAKNLDKQTKAALQNGHELMIHVPMEPMNPDLDMGAIALHVGMSAEEIKRELKDKVFPAFTGYRGINNHMGSRLTQDPEAMKLVMAQLKTRGLYFVDSRTINTSVAGKVAAQAGIAHATRDVFLDHYTDLKSVKAALRQLENVARHNGAAIGIGHPKKHTVQALKEWLPTLESKGFELVTAGKVVKKPHVQNHVQNIAKPEILQNIAPAAGEEKTRFIPQHSVPVHGYTAQDGQSVIY